MRQENGVTQIQTVYVPTDRFNPDINTKWSVYSANSKLVLRAHVHEFHDMLPLTIEEFASALKQAYRAGSANEGFDTQDEFVDQQLAKHGVVKKDQ